MHRSYATGCTWPLEGTADLYGAARRAEAVARSLGWAAVDASTLALVVVELCTNALRHGHGGSCRLEAGPDGADVIVEDQGPGFPEWALGHAPAAARGLDSVRKHSAQLVLENMAGGGGRARAVLSARRVGCRLIAAAALAG